MLKIYFILTAIILLTACSSSTNPVSTYEIFPLRVGNAWLYQYFYTDSLGNTIPGELDTVEVVDMRNIPGYTIYSVTYYHWDFVENHEAGFNFDYTNKTDGLYDVLDTNNTFPNLMLIYKYPGNPCDFYISDYGNVKIDSININISISIGTFNCYKYFFSRTDSYGVQEREIHYCSPGVGLIKVEYYSGTLVSPSTLIKQYEKVLVDYTIR